MNDSGSYAARKNAKRAAEKISPTAKHRRSITASRRARTGGS